MSHHYSTKKTHTPLTATLGISKPFCPKSHYTEQTGSKLPFVRETIETSLTSFSQNPNILSYKNTYIANEETIIAVPIVKIEDYCTLESSKYIT